MASQEQYNLRNYTYNPIYAGHFGAKKVRWITMEKALKGFILHRTLFPSEARHPIDTAREGHPYGFGNRFPDYGFDERFLKQVIYFEAVKRSELTLISKDTKELIKAHVPLHPIIKADLEFSNYQIYGCY